MRTLSRIRLTEKELTRIGILTLQRGQTFLTYLKLLDLMQGSQKLTSGMELPVSAGESYGLDQGRKADRALEKAFSLELSGEIFCLCHLH